MWDPFAVLLLLASVRRADEPKPVIKPVRKVARKAKRKAAVKAANDNIYYLQSA
jgi:hypothetical protein